MNYKPFEIMLTGFQAKLVFKVFLFQCRNVGSDGFDVQWECKAEMDDSYRFGKIQVSCEGYDYPNDPYILKGLYFKKFLRPA